MVVTVILWYLVMCLSSTDNCWGWGLSGHKGSCEWGVVVLYYYIGVWVLGCAIMINVGWITSFGFVLYESTVGYWNVSLTAWLCEPGSNALCKCAFFHLLKYLRLTEIATRNHGHNHIQTPFTKWSRRQVHCHKSTLPNPVALKTNRQIHFVRRQNH